jgi:hypothetical protein
MDEVVRKSSRRGTQKPFPLASIVSKQVRRGSTGISLRREDMTGRLSGMPGAIGGVTVGARLNVSGGAS